MALKMLVGNKSAGSIIGKGGATISSIKETSGARVKVSSNSETFPGTSDRIILLQGSTVAILNAARLVVQEIFRDPVANAAQKAAEAGLVEGQHPDVELTCTIAIPGQACGLILGKGGERINALRATTQAKIQMQSKDKAVPGLNERTVAISGNHVQCAMAVQEVSRLLLEDGTMQYENQSTNYGVLGAGAMMGGMAGAGVAGFAGYGGLLGAGLGFDHLSGLAVGGGGLGGVGGGLGLAGDSGGAPPGISFKLAIAESSVGVLVGKAGCVIKELMQISGASIKVSQKGEVVPGTTNRIVTITGSVVAANYAQMLVLQKVPDATSV